METLPLNHAQSTDYNILVKNFLPISVASRSLKLIERAVIRRPISVFDDSLQIVLDAFDSLVHHITKSSNGSAKFPRLGFSDVQPFFDSVL